MSTNKSGLLDELSIVMFTYQRQSYALRNMKFWSNRGPRLYVVDGSDIQIDKKIILELADNIKYLHHPFSLADRLGKVVELVDTKFVIFMADDDFFLPSGLEECIAELQNRPELVACCGRGIEKVLSADLIVHKSVIDGCAIQNNIGAVNCDDPLSRIIEHMKPYSPSSIYAVCRRDSWVKTVRHIAANSYSSGLVMEMTFELMMSFFGKIKIVDYLMWLRSNENPSHSVGFELEFDDWFTDPKFKKEVDLFLDSLAYALIDNKPKYEHSQLKLALNHACVEYIDYCQSTSKNIKSNNKSKQVNKKSKFTILIINILKKIISRMPSAFLMIVPYSLRYRHYCEIGGALERAGIKVDRNEFESILNMVINFYQPKVK
jgi:glycosyltransferase domain-containing protein